MALLITDQVTVLGNGASLAEWASDTTTVTCKCTPWAEALRWIGAKSLNTAGFVQLACLIDEPLKE